MLNIRDIRAEHPSLQSQNLLNRLPYFKDYFTYILTDRIYTTVNPKQTETKEYTKAKNRRIV